MRRMESASDRGPGSMPEIPGEVAPASDSGRLAGYALGASRWLPPAGVLALTFVAFLPVLDNGFIPNWDDRTNFLDNPHYRGLGLAQLRWMFTTFHAGHYIPLTWLSLGLDYLLWGMDPAGYHLTSLLLHAATALAFYFLALRLFRLALPPAPSPAALRWGAATAALLFAVHPLRVESVASATERRDVLSGLFYVLALLCYVKAAASPEAAPARLRPLWYGLSLACFAAALLSKSIVVTLPVTLLVLDVYPLRRLGGAAGWRAPLPWLEKLPFFALSAAATMVAFQALLPLGNTRSLADLAIAARIFLSVYGLAFYVFKTVVPLDLSPLYPLTVTITWWHFGFVIAVTLVAVFMRRRWRAFTAVWLVYAITLSPVLGFFHNGPQAVADRYSYLACLGWVLLIAAAAAQPRPGARVVRALLCAAVVVLCLLTWQQASVWRSAVTLWSHAASLGSGGRAAHANLAEALEADGRPREAIPHYLEALRRSAKKASWHVHLGRLYARLGDDASALRHFSEALAEVPGMPEACDGARELATRSAPAAGLLGTCAGPR
jgi:protein O-mannosyl-transferase